MSENEAINKRIYIGGLHPSTTEDSIKERFGKFGEINQVTMAKDAEGQCRGFAHMSIDTTQKKWTGCISVYKNAKWKGNILKLEDAKPDYQERKRVADEKLRERQEKRQKILQRWNQSDGFHAKDMAPVTDNNLRRGWKRGRYGRAIAVMRLKRPNGSTIVFEPTHYKNNLTKLYNTDASMKPVKRLAASYEDYKDSDDEEEYDWSNTSRYEPQEQINNNDDNDDMEETPNAPQTDDEKRKQAIERRLQEQEARKEMIRKSLAEKSNDHTTFSDDDDEKVDDAFVDTTEEQTAPKDADKWMFDDSDEDSDVEIKINPVLEGEAGRKRLELQSKFKGDERFKLGEDFIDEDEHVKESEPVGDEISQGLGAEKDQAMDVLRAMFGVEKVTPRPKPASAQQQWSSGAQWSTGARFDPDEEDSSKYLVSKPEEEGEDADMKNDDEEEEDNDDADFFAQPRKPESAMPEVSTDKHFEVNVNLKPLFGAGDDAPFSLFGGNNDTESASPAPPLFSTAFSKNKVDDNDEYDSINYAPKKKEGKIGLGVMFFFHMDQPSLMKKSCYSYDTHGVFQMKEDEKENYEEEWKKQRLQIKEVLKKRQKSAVRSQKKRAGN